jgi:hypothetical protein
LRKVSGSGHRDGIGRHTVDSGLGPGIVSAGLAGADPVYVGDVVSLDYWLKTQPEIKTPEPLKGGTIVVARYALARLELNRVNRQHAGTLAAMEARRLPRKKGAIGR